MPSLNISSSLTSSISSSLHPNYIVCSNRRTIKAYCCCTHGRRCSCSSFVGDPPSKLNSHCSSPSPPAASFVRRPMFSKVEGVTWSCREKDYYITMLTVSVVISTVLLLQPVLSAPESILEKGNESSSFFLSMLFHASYDLPKQQPLQYYVLVMKHREI